jgi:RHS repeat-associated protein
MFACAFAHMRMPIITQPFSLPRHQTQRLAGISKHLCSERLSPPRVLVCNSLLLLRRLHANREPTFKGRLCTLADKAGTTSFSYDIKGRITAKSQTVSSLTQSHSYRYNAAGQMDQWTTASGQIIGYTYANNKISGITVNGTALISNVLYDPFGPPTGWLWPSATTPNLKTYRDYDLDGRLTRWELKNGTSYLQRDVVWDDANRVTQLKDLLTTTAANPNNPQTFAYDSLDRLTTTNLGTATTASQVLTYDAIGNRTTATINGILSTYNYPSPTTSHRLTSTTGGTNPRTFTYDAMGNLTNDGKYTYTYWNNGRINTVTWVTGTAPNTTTNTATYNINALGQRVRKVTPSNVVGTRRFMYDEAGHLTGEYDSAGKLIQETVWFGDLPIATLRPKAGSTTTPIAIDIFYVHSDHPNTPRIVTRPSDNKVVWSNENTEAFGNTTPNQNPSGLGTFVYNLRLGGWQQYEQETGLFQNTNRDLDPGLGRFIQSDPIGLHGGMSTYSYVESNPLGQVDPEGLAPGGPYHPPEGVGVRCTRFDACGGLRAKMYLLEKMINSHQGWDWNNPPPRGGNRHAVEIAELWNAYARCQDFYKRKNCDGGDCEKPEKNCQTVPVPVKETAAAVGTAYIVYKLVKICGCTVLGGPVGGGVCAITP